MAIKSKSPKCPKSCKKTKSKTPKTPKSPKSASKVLKTTKYKCNGSTTVKSLKLSPKTIKPLIKSKLKPKDKEDTSTGFGAELKLLLNDKKGTSIPSEYKKAPSIELCYSLVGNPGVDLNGDLLDDDVTNTHLKYCNVIYPDTFLTRNIMCNVDDKSNLLPVEYNELEDNDVTKINKSCEKLQKINQLNTNSWLFFQKRFKTNSEKNNYIENVNKFMANPYLDPLTGKKWKGEGDVPNNENFKKFVRVSAPYMYALALQLDEIQKQPSEDTKPNIKENYVDYGTICTKDSDDYQKLAKSASLFLLFMKHSEIFGGIPNDTSILQKLTGS